MFTQNLTTSKVFSQLFYFFPFLSLQGQREKKNQLMNGVQSIIYLEKLRKTLKVFSQLFYLFSFLSHYKSKEKKKIKWWMWCSKHHLLFSKFCFDWKFSRNLLYPIIWKTVIRILLIKQNLLRYFLYSFLFIYLFNICCMASC